MSQLTNSDMVNIEDQPPSTIQPHQALNSEASEAVVDPDANSSEGGSGYIKSLQRIPNILNSTLKASSSVFRTRFLPTFSSSNPIQTSTDASRPSIPSDDHGSTTSATAREIPAGGIDHHLGHGLLLDLTDLGAVPLTTNVGPSVHVSTDESELKDLEARVSDESSDEDSLPPPWITKRSTSQTKASTSNPTVFGASSSTSVSPARKTPSMSVISPIQAQSARDSQSLLRAQLLKSQTQRPKLRDDSRQGSTYPSTSSASTEHLSRQATPSDPSPHRKSIKPETEQNQVVLDARKYFILTSAGKPVWSTEEDTDEKEGGDTTGLMGLMQAIISIFEDDGDELRYIDSGAVKIAVMLKPPLYFLVVSNWGEPESTLRLHLEYLYLLIQSIVSLSQLHKMFERRQNYDLRRTLTGTESIFRGMVDKLQWDFSVMMSGLEAFSCPLKFRDTVGRLVTPIPSSEVSGPHRSKQPPNKSKTEDRSASNLGDEAEGLNLDEVARKLLYSIVLIGGKVACLVRPKKHSVHPSDLHLIITTVLSSSSLTTSESWVPICLPGYNSTGFLHAYVTFFSASASRVGLVFVSGDRNGFFGLKQWAEEIAEHEVWRELDNGLVESDVEGVKAGASLLDKMGNESGYSLENVGIPGLRHFVYKHKIHVQVTYPTWEDDYLELENRRRLVTTYQRAYDLIHPKLSRVKDDQRPPSTFLYLRNEAEAVIAWNTSTHELYLTLSPMLSKTAAVSTAHAVVKWIKGQEDFLFLTSAPAF